MNDAVIAGIARAGGTTGNSINAMSTLRQETRAGFADAGRCPGHQNHSLIGHHDLLHGNIARRGSRSALKHCQSENTT
jgi:hypothetical protein